MASPPACSTARCASSSASATPSSRRTAALFATVPSGFFVARRYELRLRFAPVAPLTESAVKSGLGYRVEKREVVAVGLLGFGVPGAVFHPFITW